MIIRRADKNDTSGIAKVQVESWRTTYNGIVSDKYLEGMDVDARKSRWEELLKNDHHFVFVAENESGEIVGFSSGGPERTKRNDYKGELYAIYILDSYQRKGLGRALVKPLIERLQEINIHSMLVWALEENDSRHFYEALGGKETDRAVLNIAGQDHVEIAYGWEDLEELVERLVDSREEA